MQPQAPNPPAPTPPPAPPTGQPPVSSPSPNPQYDFILKNQQAVASKLKLPKPAFIIGGAIAVILIFVVLTSLLGGKKGDNTEFLDVLGHAQEIGRVSTNIQTESQDSNTIYLAATVQLSLASEEYQLSSYLSKHGIKIDPKSLKTYQSASTDSELVAAQQNNHLEATYDNYLQTNLAVYQSALKVAAVGAPQQRLALLDAANTSVNVLLTAPELSVTQ